MASKLILQNESPFPVTSYCDAPIKMVEWVWIYESYTNPDLKMYYKRVDAFGIDQNPAEILSKTFKSSFYGLIDKWYADNEQRV